MKVPEKVSEFICATVKKKDPNLTNEDVDSIVKDQLHAFENSDSKVYCETCGLVFYEGYKKSNPLMDKRFVDWKMMAFRHVWDTSHTVLVYSAFLSQRKNPLFMFLKGFRKDGQINYSEYVEEKRDYYKSTHHPRAKRSFDENWDANSRCVCSVCGKSYYNPKEACYCCLGEKPWMYYPEADTIKVKEVIGGE